MEYNDFNYDEILNVFTLAELLEECGISEAEVLEILINNGYLELPDYVRRLSYQTTQTESEEA